MIKRCPYLVGVLIGLLICTSVPLVARAQNNEPGLLDVLWFSVSNPSLAIGVAGQASQAVADSWVGQLIGAVEDIVAEMLAVTSSVFIGLLGVLIWMAGLVFDLSVYISVTNFSEWVDKTKMIHDGWVLFRDLVNVVFIFVVLYIAISTILQLGSADSKRLLAKVIVVALLVNFSAFFTKIVIDVSNVVASEFATRINPTSNPFDKGNIGRKFVAGLNLVSNFREPGPADFDASITGKAGSVWNVLSGTISSTAVMLMAIFALFAAAIMFIIRMVVLVFLIIISPLAFLAYAIPGLSGKLQQWWSRLLNEAFFAPIFLAFIYIVVKAIESGALATIDPGPGGVFGQAAKSQILIILNGIILTAMLVASIIFAKKMSATSASLGLKWAHNVRKQAQTFAGRNTLGRASRKVAESDWLKQQIAKRPIIGGMLKNIADAGAKQKFGGKGDSFKDVVEQRTKAAEGLKDRPELQAQYIQNLGPGRLAQTLQKIPVVGRAIPATSQIQEAVYGKLKPEQKLKLEEVVDKSREQARQSVKNREQIERERADFMNRAENKEIQNWFNSTPEPLRYIPGNQGKINQYNSYVRKVQEYEAAMKIAPSNARELAAAQQQASLSPTMTKISLRRLRMNLSESDRGKIEDVIKKKKRDQEIRDLEAISKNDRNPDQEEQLTKLIRERKEDKDRDALAGAAREAAKEGAKEGGGGGGGGGGEKKDEK